MMVISVNAQSNSYFSVTYTGYANGKYAFKLVNYQSYDVSYSVSYQNVNVASTSTGWNGGDVNGTPTFYVTAPFNANAVFTFISLTNAGLQNNNPVVVNIATDLPVTFTGPPVITAVTNNYVTIQFTVANQSQMKQYIVRFSRDGGNTWQNVAFVVPDNTQTGKTYSVNVNLN